MTVNAKIQATCFQSFLKKKKTNQKKKPLKREWENPKSSKSATYYIYIVWEMEGKVH